MHKIHQPSHPKPTRRTMSAFSTLSLLRFFPVLVVMLALMGEAEGVIPITVTGATGNTITIRIMENGDTYPHLGGTETAVGNFSPDQRTAIETAFRYYVDIFDTLPTALSNTVVVAPQNAGHFDSARAHGSMDDQYICIDMTDINTYATSNLSQISLFDINLATLVCHELVHVAGENAKGNTNGFTTQNGYNQYLSDGNRMAFVGGVAGQFTDPDGANYFNATGDSVVFLGPNAVAVYGEGVPVVSPDPYEPGNSLSHLNLPHSITTTGDRTFFSEVELAMFQDLGAVIDRKKYFGRSLYQTESSTINNTIGYTGDGIYGVGLHMVAGRNTVIQSADIIASGDFATGIRVENNRNHVTVASGTTILMNGVNGIGVLFDYSTDSSLINNGTIIANSTNGKGVCAYSPVDEIINNGVITANGYNGTGISTSYSVNALKNAGTINANGRSGSGVAVTANEDEGVAEFVNTGTINANGIDGRGVLAYGPIDVFINDGVINANGNNGEGLAVQSEGHYVNNGSINATGTDGTAVSLLGDNYFYNNGVLNAANNTALYADQGAMVFFMAGTQINGDITAGTGFSATITFGSSTDSDGMATQTPDNAFVLVYDGDINDSSFVGNTGMTTYGGFTSFTGDTYVTYGRLYDSSELNIQGYSSFTSDLTIFQNATLSGTGTVAAGYGGIGNDGLISPGNVMGEIATLTLEGKLTNTSLGNTGIGGTFLIDIDPSHGQANTPVVGTHNDLVDVKKNIAAGIDGEAVINGGGVLVNSPSNDKNETKTPARYAVGSKYVFLQTEDGLTVDKDLDVQTVEKMLLFDFVGDYNTNDYWLEVKRQYEYGKFGDTYNQVQVGNSIDEVGSYPDPERDIFDVLVTLDQLNKDAGIPHRAGISGTAKFALDQMSGAIYGSLANASVQNTTIVNNTLSGLLRRNAFSKVLYTSTGCKSGGDVGCESECESGCEISCANPFVKADRNLWALGYGTGGSTKHDGNAYGYNQRFGGTMFGADTYGDYSRFGVYFSYGEGRVATDLYDRAESREFLGGFYYRKEMYCGYIMASGALGYNRYDTYRNLHFLGRKTDNRHGGMVGTAYVERGLEFEGEYLQWQPYIGLQYVGNRQNSFQETGGGDVSLNVDKINAGSLRTVLGSQFAVEVGRVATGTLSAHLNAAWMHECLDPCTDVSAQFTDLNMSRFTVRGNNIGKDWGILQMGLNHEYERISLYASYDIYMNSHQVLHTGNVGFALDW